MSDNKPQEWHDPDRGPGILTRMDREYLAGLKASQNESRIRDRIRNSLLDFEYLATGRGQELLRDVLRGVKSPSQDRPLWAMAEEERVDRGDDELGLGLAVMQFALFQALMLERADLREEMSPSLQDEADEMAGIYGFLPEYDAYRDIIEEGLENAMLGLFHQRGYHADFRVTLLIQQGKGRSELDWLEAFHNREFVSAAAIEFLLEEELIDPGDVDDYADEIDALDALRIFDPLIPEEHLEDSHDEDYREAMAIGFRQELKERYGTLEEA